jgi:uncharacterized membrane protein YdjX (TVP38/TMEM64 family)
MPMDQLIAGFQDLLAFDGALLTAALIAGLWLVTASLVAAGTPGVVIPATLAAEALAGPIAATATVSLGAMGGSLLLFAATRRWGSPVLSRHVGSRLESFERRFAAHGIWYIVGLRMIGTPHMVVTVGSAMMPIRTPAFAAATLMGFLPSIALAAMAGSAF